MKKEILPDLLKRYLRGETTPEESVMVDEWYVSLQENPDDISLLDPLELNIVQHKIFDRIKGNIDLPAENKPVRRLSPGNLFSRTPFKLAAAITAIAVIGLGAIFFKQKGLPTFQYENYATITSLKKTNNNTEAIRRVMLEDGTVITLKPNSSIEYPEKFSGDERNVKLRGEAFFDVAKDKERPFIISASDVTVRVLGTSFNVMAYEGAKEISVAVKTGKVSVYAKAKHTILNPLDSDEEVILTPNQEAVYNTSKESFSKKLVDKPQIVLEKPTLFETQYDGAPVRKILNVLEQNYGINIQFDEQALSDCILTTSMAEEGLYERIEIICKAIGAQYEINDTSIIIKSSGCH
jgi:transmembrane sensor